MFTFRHMFGVTDFFGRRRPRICVTFSHPDSPTGNMHVMTGDKIRLHGSGWTYTIGVQHVSHPVAPGWYKITGTEVVKL